MPQKRLPEASDGSRGTGDVVELTSDPGQDRLQMRAVSVPRKLALTYLKTPRQLSTKRPSRLASQRRPSVNSGGCPFGMTAMRAPRRQR